MREQARDKNAQVKRPNSGSARKKELHGMLSSARERTLQLLAQVPEELLNLRVHDFYSPVGWHFGHIGMTEEAWVMTQALKRPCLDADLAFLFANLPENPKDNRVHLPGRAAICAYLASTREATCAALDETDLTSSDPLIRDGYAWDFAQQHECQHQETILELLQLLCKRQISTSATDGNVLKVVVKDPQMGMISMPGGIFMMGSDDPHGYDNEMRAHEVRVQPFQLDETPVTNGQWLAFIEDGGYRRPEVWSDAGWHWRETEAVIQPEYWHPSQAFSYAGNGLRDLRPDEPVCGIGWYEADAYARWVGKRLPTEAEWEFAAGFDPDMGQATRFPGSDHSPVTRHHGVMRWGPQSIGERGVNSALGLRSMGQVWEWTSSPFMPYPGFVAFPYDGYSRDHMDGHHYVCRGGSWASDCRILRCSFRNWYVPTYRQGFLGLRCAR